jgi:DNA polymerase I-like protein with 3'-5' exonuclease and polymerase domains
VSLPHGELAQRDAATHPGQLLGLYAQSYSSKVFSEALVRVVALLRGTLSRVIFTVHDELVVDMHPDDEAAGLAERIVQEMQGTQFVVKAKKGRTYGDATR